MRGLKPLYVIAERVRLPLERARLSLKGKGSLARGLRPRDCDLFSRIEQGRQDMLCDHSPLVDGSLGPPAIYDQDVTIAGACGVSKRPNSAWLLHSLANEYRPGTILELGTNVGISSAYLAASGSNVITLDASSYRQRLAKSLHEKLGLDVDYVEGLFTDTLGATLDRMAPVRMAFIDGHHQYQPTLDYFEAIAAKAAPGCVFVFDDIRWSSGMKRAWRELRRDPRFDAVSDLGGMGVGVLR
jgi:predicted O-methyltransferase YrrM